MVVAPDTIAPPLPEAPVGRERSRGPGDQDVRKEQLRGIFAGSQVAKDRERERVESWVILPSVNSRKAIRAIRVDPSNAGDATIRARKTGDPHRLSRNVDAVIDAQQGQEQLLERALRPRGLSDSSIRSTFISHGEATRRMLAQVGAVEIASSSPYDNTGGPIIAVSPPTAIPKSETEPLFHAPSIAYTATSASASTSTSPARAIPARRLGTTASFATESMPGSMVSGARFPRRMGSTWAGVLSDEEDSFQVGSFKEGVSFSGSVVRHRDRASGRGVSEHMHLGA
ncbi:hypothetical protein FRC08_017936 [Ceratobasidium sp. 394]|nr:hypothetical protein FRC08_017936 [Ceratobasidium sp. 394]